MDFLTLIGEVGFPIAAALAAGLFVFITLRFILDGVLDDIKQQRIFVQALDNRIKTMNNEIIRIDVMISEAVGLTPDLDRIARADGQKDARKD
jgi:archaellum biogenesis ATPase FlaH